MRSNRWGRLGIKLSRAADARPTKAGAFLLLAVVCTAGILAASIKMASKSSGRLVATEPDLIWKGPVTGGGGAAAKLRFELKNVGGRPVRIISVKSGCGCAKPEVSSRLVAPGRVSLIDVVAMTVPLGEKLVRIDVHTDSPLEPDVPLTVKLVGTRTPPFLYLLEGEAVFLGEYSQGMHRDVGVLTVENQDQGPGPEILLDLHFLHATLTGVEAKPFMTPGTFLRTWRYRIPRLQRERPPFGVFQGVLYREKPLGLR